MSPNDEQLTALVAGVRVLSELFWGPNLQKCHEILDGTYFQPLTTLESVLEFHPPDVLQRIESELKNYTDANSRFQYLETGYVRLFISHRDGIAAPLYESCYFGVEAGDTAPLMGKPALRMKQRFESKGLLVDSNIHEPPDHLAIELEFLYFLLEKGRSDYDRKLIAEASSFSSDVMLPWTSKLQERLAVESECRFYFLITSILTAVLYFISGFEKLGSQKES